MSTLTPIAHYLQQVCDRIRAAALQCGRPPESVRLLAVSKTFGADAVCAAMQAGQTCFGENYVQEAVAKMQQVHALCCAQPPAEGAAPRPEWHCIGPIQSRKTALVAQHFDWVHSLDRVDIALRLSRQRPAALPPLQVCIQVNMDGAPTKSGVPAADVWEMLQSVLPLPQLQLRGLMSIPDLASDPQHMRDIHQRTRTLFDDMGARLRQAGHTGVQWDTLSMGMSADLEAAIAAGSTLVRVGSAIFGQRAVA